MKKYLVWHKRKRKTCAVLADTKEKAHRIFKIVDWHYITTVDFINKKSLYFEFDIYKM